MSTIEFLQPQALLGNIEIEAELMPDLPPVSCDEHQIKQVFINIMKNALEAMSQGGTMRIQAHTGNNRNQINSFVSLIKGAVLHQSGCPSLENRSIARKKKEQDLALWSVIGLLKHMAALWKYAVN